MRVLDLGCGVGGASVGYYRAGHSVVGVDIVPQPDYPFPFVQADMLSLPARFLDQYDFIHASPPCQADCTLTAGTNRGREYPNLTVATRDLLYSTCLPFTMENPPGRTALLRDLVLCGEMFGLGVIRHRVFQFRHDPPPGPEHVPHRGRVRGWRHGVYHDGPYVAVYGDGGGKGSVAEWQAAMDIDWSSSRYGLAQAIPPAYTEYIGRFLR
jgi:SAM-dependent methyltransferase